MYNGQIKKMRGTLNETNRMVFYQFILSDHEIDLNQVLGKQIHFHYSGKMSCIQCQRVVKKTFQQGYCYPCLESLQECNLCTIFPERCRVEEDNCPETWSHEQCHQEHFVYLANSSGLKVGITRTKSIPSRWIDQGARQGLCIFKTSNRYQAGLIESALKKYVADRTQWQKLLKQEAVSIDLSIERDRLLDLAKNDIELAIKKSKFSGIELLDDKKINEINFPVNRYPEKIKNLSFDKQQELSGTLLGIKGQYLIFEQGVINIRKFGGYEINLRIGE